MGDCGFDLSMYFPRVFPIARKSSSFQQWSGRWGRFTHTDTALGMYFSGSNERSHLLRYIPLGPMKYGPFLKIRSRSSLFSNMKTKYLFPQKICCTSPQMRGLQFLLSHTSTDLGECHNPVSNPIKPFSDKVIAFLLKAMEESLTFGTSERLTKREEEGALDVGGAEDATIRINRSSNPSGSGGSMATVGQSRAHEPYFLLSDPKHDLKNGFTW